MRGTDRRKELLQWLVLERNPSLQQIVLRFGVSKMTVHRDLEMLEQRKALKRIHGGAVLMERREERLLRPVSGQGTCVLCARPISHHLLYRITLKNGEQRVACCSRCGVSAHLMLDDQVASALTADFLTGKSHPAQESTFVLGSSAGPCCKPSVLSFEDAEMALKFKTSFGGTLGELADVLRCLQNKADLYSTAEASS